MSLRELLRGPATRPNLSADELSTILSRRYVASDEERERVRRHKERHSLYEGGGKEILLRFIDTAFSHPEVRKLRRELAEYANYNNVLRRVTHEISTVYSEKPLRTVAGENENYAELQRRTRIDQRLRTANRWLNLHREVLIGFRVRDEGTEQAPRRVPVIDVVHPGGFHAISHPMDHTRLVGVILKQAAPDAKPTDPHYRVWSNFETFQLDELGTVVGEVEDNPFPRMPWILAHAEPPSLRLLDSVTGSDLVAAHLAVWFQNVLLIKESKSANKQVIFQGDTSNIVHGQPAETEYDLDVGEGVTTTAVDRTMDLALFRDTADHILERAAGNYGIPPSILQHHGATSGHEIDLRRIPIRELRRDQIVVWREIERELAEVMSMVVAVDMPELAFSLDGWQIDFAEVQTPQSESERLQNFETRRRLSLTSTIDEIRKQNPDLSTDQAAAEHMAKWISDEVLRNALIEPLKAMNASADSEPDRPTAEENGRRGLEDDEDDDDDDDREAA